MAVVIMVVTDYTALVANLYRLDEHPSHDLGDL
jgi:hypothetical protein